MRASSRRESDVHVQLVAGTVSFETRPSLRLNQSLLVSVSA
jgi:hypothetical protein